MTIKDIEQVDALSSGTGGGAGRSRGRPRRPGEGTVRIMRITTGRGAFMTPARMVSHGEQIARSEIPISRALPAELAMDFGVVRSGDAAVQAAGGAARLGRSGLFVLGWSHP